MAKMDILGALEKVFNRVVENLGEVAATHRSAIRKTAAGGSFDG